MEAMMADPVAEENLTIIYGDTEYLEGVVTDADGNTVDLTAVGAALEFTMRRTFSHGTAAVSKDLTSGITGDASGNYTVTIDDAEKSKLSEGHNYHYSLRYTDPVTAEPRTVAHGRIRVLSSAAIV